jgi:hypothetical protein
MWQSSHGQPFLTAWQAKSLLSPHFRATRLGGDFCDLGGSDVAKVAPINELSAKHFAAAHRYLQLAEAQASSELKPAPK